MKLSLFSLLALLIASPLAAQTTPTLPDVRMLTGQSYIVTITHDGVQTEGYRVRLDGQTTGQDMPVQMLTKPPTCASAPDPLLCDGTVSLARTGITVAKTYTLSACAFGSIDESTKSGESCMDVAHLIVSFAQKRKPPTATVTVTVGVGGSVTTTTTPSGGTTTTTTAPK